MTVTVTAQLIDDDGDIVATETTSFEVNNPTVLNTHITANLSQGRHR